jgi:hypothetical protein
MLAAMQVYGTHSAQNGATTDPGGGYDMSDLGDGHGVEQQIPQ